MHDSSQGNLQQSLQQTAEARRRHYAEIINPLFWNGEFNRVERMFELVCTLVRANGMKDTGWDSYYESLALLQDLNNLQLITLPEDKFPNPDNTQARLALISYCHVVEMNLPYELLTNLLRLRLGKKYSTEPLAHLASVTGGKRVPKRVKPPTPEKKIAELEKLSEEAGMPEIGKALRDIYDPVIRNAVYHSDYALHDGSMRLLSGSRFFREEGCNSPLITFAELAVLTNEAFAFHSALTALYKRSCTLFTDFRDKFLPFDHHYKGLLEFTFEGDLLTGFRTYWPNGFICRFGRDVDGRSHALNLIFEPDGSINFMIGDFAVHPGTFSPCVEADGIPVYGKVPGKDKAPYWPSEMKAITL